MTMVTMEQVLRDIMWERGMSALRNGEALVGLFQDFSQNRMRPQANALKVFVFCQGNTRILNLHHATAQDQQVQIHRLVQEMITQHNMREETAVEVCNAFWRVAIGTEFPISTESGMTAEEMYQRGKQDQDAPGMENRHRLLKAKEWFEKAARQNHLGAQKGLGLVYQINKMEGEPKDSVKSAYRYRKATEQGNKSAADRIPGMARKLVLLSMVVFLVLMILSFALDSNSGGRTRSDLKPYNLEDSTEDMLLAGTEQVYTYPDGTSMEFYYDDAGKEICRVYVNTEKEIENLFEARYDSAGRLVCHQIFDGAGNLLRADSYDFHGSEDTAQRRITLGNGRNLQGVSTFGENGDETFTLNHQDGTKTVYVYRDGGALTDLTEYDAAGEETVSRAGYGYDWENTPKVFGPRQTVMGWSNGNNYTRSYVQGLCGGALKEYSVVDSASEEAAFIDIYDPMGNLLEMRQYRDAQLQELACHEVCSYDQQGNYTGYTNTYYYGDGDYFIEQYDAGGIRLTQEIHRFEGEEETVLYNRYETEVDEQGRELRIQTFDGQTGRLEAIEENEYDAEGELKQETRTAYYEDGRYNISVRNGDWKTLSSTTYYPDGSVSDTTEYTAEGVQKKQTQYYENGQVESVWEYNDQGKNARYTSYYENGNTKWHREYNSQGEIIKSVVYNEDGTAAE